MSVRTGRQLLVWLHVASSVSWMSQAAALAVLLFTAIGPASVSVRVGAATSAKLLDATLLVYSANIATATGLLLAATTSWGFWLHRWVAIKLVLTTGQLYVGIGILSPRMDAAVTTVASGGSAGVAGLGAAATLMAGAFAVQVWLSVAKPGGRTRRAATARRPGSAPAWLFALAVLAPIAETVLGVAVTGPLPVLSLVVLTVAAAHRTRARKSVPGHGQALTSAQRQAAASRA